MEAFLYAVLFLNVPKFAPLGYVSGCTCHCYLFLSIMECEQRDHYFMDMAIRYTEIWIERCGSFWRDDPGRFVPTYTIFCESIKPRWKRDPSFDRSDLALITQNALADGTYMKYIRSHYDVSRRTHYNAFERWLGRDEMYPKDPLILPTDEEVQQAFQSYMEQAGQDSEDGKITVEGIQGVFAINGLISKMIFDKNKETRAFYIEESFPMDWYYPYATPFGLCLKINKEPLKQIPQDVIQKDRAYWDAYTKKLVENPKFQADRPAKMSFSKLRSSIGNVYMYRNLLAEAEYAYKQALEMAPDNAEVVFRLADLYANQNRFSEAQALADNLKKLDPNNTQIDGLIENLKARQQQIGQRAQLEQAVNQSKGAFQQSYALLTFYLQINDLVAANRFIDQLMPYANFNAKQWQQFAEAMLGAEQIDSFFKVLKRWEMVDPKNPELSYDLGVLYASNDQTKEAIQALEKAIRYGTNDLKKEILEDERLQEIQKLPEFKKMIEQTKPEKE
ncbi:MAG: tetratricopeptide repeat protein [Verrucomicrobiia bacterium]